MDQSLIDRISRSARRVTAEAQAERTTQDERDGEDFMAEAAKMLAINPSCAPVLIRRAFELELPDAPCIAGAIQDLIAGR